MSILRRTVVASVLVGVAAASAVSSPAAADDPLLDRARSLVTSVAGGQPLRVVETSTGPDGVPRYTTTVVDSRGSAVALVQRLLGQGRTVSMGQPVQAAVSNDPLRPRQWALSSLRAESVWRLSAGGTTGGRNQTVVAVVDTGVFAHRDLRRGLLTGRDFVDPGTSPTDPNGHGTHVAGIVGATANNGLGIAGLAPKTKILPVRVLDALGSGSTDVIARGVVWAVEKGADVVNLSLTGDFQDAALRRAVAFAQQRGAVVVAAAGNDGGSLACLFGCPAQYPAAYAGVVGVGSVDSNQSRSSFSSTGSWVDVAAPGGGIISTVPAANRIGCAGSSYCTISGTSMASPHVAAAVAVALSRHPAWGAAGTTRRLLATADDRGTAGRDSSYGAGYLDVLGLLRAR